MRRFSYAVKTDITRLCAAALGIVFCAAAQDVAPLIFGAKPPFLLALGCFAGIPTAIVAGLFADALGSMSFGCSAAFFAIVAAAVRFVPRGWATKVFCVVVAAGAYQLWIALWFGVSTSPGAVLGAKCAAGVVAPAMYVAVKVARRWIGIDFDRRRA